MNTASLIAAAIGGIGVFVLILKMKSKINNERMQKLDKQEAETKAKLEVVNEERKTIVEKVEAEHKNASEEKKEEFWNNYVNDKDKK